MAEKFNDIYSEQPINPEKKFIRVESELKSADGKHQEFSVALAADGKPKAFACFDIDGTLAELRFVHKEAIQRMFPNVDGEDVAKQFFDAFGVVPGNSIREFDRMIGINFDGHDEWRDPYYYVKNRLELHQKEIDDPGSPVYKRAADYAHQYSVIAGKVIDEFGEKNSELFERAKIKPIIHLAELYKRRCVPSALMTANGREFTEAAIRRLDLDKLFINAATDENMAGGGKEKAIEYLTDWFKQKTGIGVAKDRLITVGDSLKGDVGSGYTYRKKIDSEAKNKGILVLHNEETLANIKNIIAENQDLAEVIKNVPTEGIVLSLVTYNKEGRPQMGKTKRKNFLVNFDSK